MTRATLTRVLAGWAVLTALGCIIVHETFAIDASPVPEQDAELWALDALEAARTGDEIPEPPESATAYEADAPITVVAWHRGIPIVRHEAGRGLVEAVTSAAQVFGAHELLVGLPQWRAAANAPARVRFTVTVPLGSAPILLGVPYLEEIGVVPLHEGLVVEVGDAQSMLTPSDIQADNLLDTGIPTPIPDLSLGIPVAGVVDRLARNEGRDVDELHAEGSIRRFRAHTISEAVYPKTVEVNEENLRRAAVEGARFLIRHMNPDGTYTYIYDARTGRAQPAPYNLPRHSGTTYFLAQVHNLHGLPEAREAAIRALRWISSTRIHRCGAPENWCVEAHGRVELGSSALTALAAAEVLAGGEEPFVRELLEGLTSYMRSIQREDGELMHGWDMQGDAPIDVQYLYYSGEAAFALLRAHAVIGDERDLEASRGVMRHLTGEGWDFFGSRYYYGEEHWTCIAAGEASDRIDSPEALDFCRRWGQFNRQVQYGPGETPWESEGAYGVGPLIIPRLTPVGSRSEAFISTYQMSRRAGADTEALRAQIEAGLGMLLRYRWDPGPTHLMADPEGAQGGIPGSPADLTVRNDFVQHAASAMIRWADILRQEREEAPN